MSDQWKKYLLEFFMAIKTHDDELEPLRTNLCSDQTFNPLSLFSVIDKHCCGKISIQDMKNFLDSKLIQYEDRLLRCLIHNFDRDNDFAINFNEFLKIILPHRNDALKRDIKIMCNNDNFARSISKNTEQLFIKLIFSEFDLIKLLSNISINIRNSENFTTYESFMSITGNDKYITNGSLGAFLNRNNYSVSMLDAFLIIQRIDTDDDGKISYDEYKEMFFSSELYNPEPSIFIPNYNSNNNNNISNTYGVNSKLMNKTVELLSGNGGYNEAPRSPGRSYMNFNERTYKYELSPQPYLNNYNYKSPRSDMNDVHSHSMMVNKDDLINKYSDNYFGNGSSSDKDIISQSAILPSNYNLKPMVDNNNDNKMTMPMRDYMNTVIKQSSGYGNKYFYNSLDRPNNYTSPIPDMSTTKQGPSFDHCCKYANTNQANCKKLFNLFNDIIMNEAQIESIKNCLALCSDANLMDLFKFFDYSDKNAIGPIDMSRGLKDIGCGIYASIENVKKIFERFDLDGDHKINYKEFCAMILPRKFNLAKEMSEKQPPNTFKGFSSETKKLLISFYSTVIDGERTNQRYRQAMELCDDKSIKELYEILKKPNFYGIYKDDLEDFMKTYGKEMTEDESELLMDRLDKKKVGYAEFEEFLEEITPKMLH